MAYQRRRKTRRATPRNTRRKSYNSRNSRSSSYARRRPTRSSRGGGLLKIVVEQRTAAEPLMVGPTGQPMKTVEKRKGRF